MCCNIKEWCPHDPVYSILFRPVGSGEEGTRAAPGNAAPPLATNHPPRANSGGQPEILQIGCGGGGGGRRRDWGDGRGCCQFRSGLGPLIIGLLLTESCDLVMTPACHAVYCIGSSVYCRLLCCPPRALFLKHYCVGV